MGMLFFVLSTVAIICLVALIAEKPKEIDHSEYDPHPLQDNSYIQVRRIDGADTAGRRTIDHTGPRVIRREQNQSKIKIRQKERQDRKCFYCGHTNKMVYKQFDCECCNKKNGTDDEVFKVFN